MIQGNLLKDFIRMTVTALWIAGVSLTFRHLLSNQPAPPPAPTVFTSGVSR